MVGVVESRDDPMRLGRCKVRVVGVHTPDKVLLPTNDLPWAIQVISNSASMNGIGSSPTNYVEGSTVLVVFTDEDMQIPIIIGSLLGIPQTNSKLIDSIDDNILVDFGEGTEPLNNSSVAENPEKLDTKVVNIPTSGSGQAALEKAMTDAGITSQYARASILGICLVESNFKTSAENLNYSKSRLIEVFPSIFKGNPASAEAVAGKPENTAEVIYGPIRGKGKELGNTVVGDAFKYRGRGFVQLTGKFNYKKYSSVAGVDLVENPDELLNEDVAARVTVQYFKDRVSVSQDSPGYINSAISAVGHNSRDIYAKKLSAYQKFLGENSTVAMTDKSTDDSDSAAQHNTSVKVNGIPVDRISALNYGFSDPKFKYPLKDYLNEPDTNRLARGRYNNTIVTTKDNNSIVGVPTADGKKWNQPISPYNAEYPFNHIYESESGHVQEFDDTPGNERVHMYHRTGTFDEVDCNGTKVTRIVGDKYEIIDRDGYVFISGNVNMTASGNINILSQSTANIQIHGDANVNVHGNANLNVGSNMNTNVRGTYSLKAASIKFQSSNVDILSSNYKLKSDSVNISSDDYRLTTDDASFIYNGDLSTHIGGDTYKRNDSGIDYSCPADPSRSSSDDCSSVPDASQAGGTGLGTPINKLNTINPKFKPLSTPIRNPSKVLIFESPEELNGAQPVVKDIMPEKQVAPVEKVKNVSKDIPKTGCDVYAVMTEFPTSMVLFTDSTGYDWTLGKLTRGRKLSPVTIRGVTYTESDIVCNLKSLAENVLSKINEKVGRVDSAWSITSCYRNEIPLGGSATSQHLSGQAVDISIGGNLSYKTTYDWAKEFAGSLSFDQLILEYLDRRGQRINWIHVGYKSSGNRKQVITFLNHRTNNQGLKLLA